MDFTDVTFGQVILLVLVVFVGLVLLVLALTGITALGRAFTRGWRTPGRKPDANDREGPSTER